MLRLAGLGHGSLQFGIIMCEDVEKNGNEYNMTMIMIVMILEVDNTVGFDVDIK